jgi:hypothetical protein
MARAGKAGPFKRVKFGVHPARFVTQRVSGMNHRIYSTFAPRLSSGPATVQPMQSLLQVVDEGCQTIDWAALSTGSLAILSSHDLLLH